MGKTFNGKKKYDSLENKMDKLSRLTKTDLYVSVWQFSSSSGTENGAS